MTGKELLLAALRNGATPRTPWVPFVGVHGGALAGVTATDYLKSDELIVRGLSRAKELYQPDGLPVVFDLQMEAEVLGCPLRWADDTPPAVAGHPLTSARLSDLPAFDADAGRFPVVWRALERMRAECGADTALYGLITGPFTLALHLLGNDIFLRLRRDPAAVSEILRFCTGVGERAALAYVDHGADVVAVVDPMTSQISPRHFDEFILPHLQTLFAAIRGRGAASSMFVCGDATRNLHGMCRTGADNVSIDENVPLDLCREIAAGEGRSFGGNLKLTSVLLLGDEDDARLEALRCLDVGGTNGFVLAPGCDLPFHVPPRNLQAVAQMVHDDYQRHVAAMTLRAKVARSFDDVHVPDYRAERTVIVDVITLDSASCAPCQYMVAAAAEAAARCGGSVVVHERKISTHEGLGFMTKLSVGNVPTICIDGEPRFVSIIPDANTLLRAFQEAVARKAGS